MTPINIFGTRVGGVVTSKIGRDSAERTAGIDQAKLNTLVK